MIWSGFLIFVLIILTGFSRAILGILQVSRYLTNLKAAICSVFFFLNHAAPETAKCVHGGKAIIMSQPSSKTSNTFFCICHSGFPPLGGKISQEYASCPFVRNALHTVWLSSHAISIFILSSSFSWG